MATSQRPGEITYYDELGVERTASADEIRDSFRSLARLLHPDGQTDPQLKDMAERQMRKLNRIYAVLSDPARRTAYDESQDAPRNGPVIIFSGSDGNLKKLITRWGAIAAVVCGTLFLIWFAVDSGSSSEVRGQEARGSATARTSDGADGEAGDQIAQLRARIRTLETERNSALEQLGRTQGKQASQSPAARTAAPPEPELTAATSLSELPSTTRPAVNSSQVRTAAADERALSAAQFAGVWVSSKSSGSASPGGKAQYSPELIEVTVTEQNGTLHGQYHSRYEVLDHAISPNVDFLFNGTPVGSALNCAWQGAGGAKGRMTMKLLPGNSVEIAWNATELGSQQWLTSGTATFIRK